jgi:hypothetical protein
MCLPFLKNTQQPEAKPVNVRFFRLCEATLFKRNHWRIGRSLSENLFHGRPVGSEVFLQPSANTAFIYMTA